MSTLNERLQDIAPIIGRVAHDETSARLKDIDSAQAAVSNGISITKTTSGAQTLLPAVDRARMITGFFVEVTEDYLDNTGTQPAWSLGDTDDATRWDGGAGVQAAVIGNSTGTNAADLPKSSGSGALTSGGCILDAGKEIIVTCTPAVGDATGACKLVVITVNAP